MSLRIGVDIIYHKGMLYVIYVFVFSKWNGFDGIKKKQVIKQYVLSKMHVHIYKCVYQKLHGNSLAVP